jgi:hypothetical protein
MRAFVIAALLILGVATAQAAVIEQTVGAVTMRRLDGGIDWCEDCIQGMVLVINEVVRFFVRYTFALCCKVFRFFSNLFSKLFSFFARVRPCLHLFSRRCTILVSFSSIYLLLATECLNYTGVVFSLFFFGSLRVSS